MKLCQIYYDAAHYRAAIYRKIDEEFDVDSYFGIPPGGDIVQMDVKGFRGKVLYTPIRKFFGGIFYQRHILSLIWSPYDVYLGLGETHGISTWLFSILLRLFKPRKRLYFWSHGWYGRESKLQTIIKRIFFKLPNGGTFVYGDYARRLMIKEGIRPDKIFVIHNSLAYDAQLAIRKTNLKSDVYARHYGNDNQNLIFIGRLTSVKKLDMIIEAMALLKNRGMRLNLTFVGDGSEREKLEGKSWQCGLAENIWFYGASYDEAKNAELIYNADLCVSPGNIGLTAIHVLMFGCPAITHNEFKFQVPEVEAIKQNETGSFYEYGSISSLAAVIEEWLAGHQDRDAVRSACYREVDTQWNPDYQIKVLKEHLR